MLIKCTNPSTYTDLNQDVVYTVYAMVIDKGVLKYFICTEKRSYPFWYPANLFEIVESRISKYWSFCKDILDYNNDITLLIAYSAWADNPWHYDDIVDKNKNAIETFQRYKELMYLEFPDSSVELKATALEEGWVMCPECVDAWQPNTPDAMIICPKCKHVMHNSFYVDLV